MASNIKDYKNRFDSPIGGTFTPPKKSTKSKGKDGKKNGTKK